MQLADVIRTTAAIREFTDEPVSDGQLGAILDQARFAPSGGNRQGWRLICVQDPSTRRALRDLYCGVWYQYLAAVSAGLVPFAPVTDRDLDRYSIVGGASIYPFAWNILLSARDAGLGGVITTMVTRDEPTAKQLLGVPDEYAVAALLALGHPRAQPRQLRRAAVADFTTIDRFDGPPLRAEL